MLPQKLLEQHYVKNPGSNQCCLDSLSINLDDYQPDLRIPLLMKQEHLCFKCAFWLDRYYLDKYDETIIPLIVSDHYRDSALYNPFSHWIMDSAKIVDPSYELCELPKFVSCYILMKSGQLYLANHPTHQGTIPPHFKKLFPVNARFLKETEARPLIELKGTSINPLLRCYQIPEYITKRYFKYV